MPITISSDLPAFKTLESENIFIMPIERAIHQDIRPLKIVILNLMPTKIETETQLLRVLSNTPLQVDIELLQTATHQSKNTPSDHLLHFYKVFDEIKDRRFDGMIITGAPVENLEFEQVNYWDELCTIMEWSKTHVYSTLHICWGAQAGLFYHHGIPKHPLEKKMFGLFLHRPVNPNHALLRGFDEEFLVPHSRHTEVRREDIEKDPSLEILSYSQISGVHIVADKACRNFYVTGHSEYDVMTLAKEYFRDKDKGLNIDVPYNYFPNNDPTRTPLHTWRSHAHLLFANWLNYFVYQATPYDLSQLG